jgi:hypothetical protein
MMCRGEGAERYRTIAGRILGLDRTEAAAMALFTIGGCSVRERLATGWRSAARWSAS